MAQTLRCELTPNAPPVSTPLQGEHMQPQPQKDLECPSLTPLEALVLSHDWRAMTLECDCCQFPLPTEHPQK